MVLNGVFVASVGLNNNTEYYKIKSTGSDLDRSRLTDTRSAENDWIGADTEDRCIPNLNPKHVLSNKLVLSTFKALRVHILQQKQISALVFVNGSRLMNL